MSETDSMSAPTAVPPRRKRGPLRRAGCTFLVVIWFLILLLPCFCLVLATQGEIVIPQGSAPGQVLRVWLIMEADERGLGISSTSVQQTDENQLCVESNTRFLLWTGNAEPGISCECYARETADQPFTTISVASQACAPQNE